MRKDYFLKRPFDLCLALAGIMFFLPFWVLFSFLIWLEAKGRVFYIQIRVGKNRQLFKTLKFRTLYNKDSGYMASTRLGMFLRVTALDESLQLINILKGEMSFVGPRPLIPEEVGTEARLEPRFSVRPGLTGLSQVLCSKDIGIMEKFKYDLLYIERQSLSLDLKLILVSFVVSFRGKWEDRGDKIKSGLGIFNPL